MKFDQRQKITRYALGFGASALALYFLLAHSSEPVVFFASLFLLIISITDTLRGKIPNLATLTLVIVGLGYNLRSGGLTGGVLSAAGLLTGLALFLAPYLMGGIGGGDIKALAALGALIGPIAIFQVFLLTGLIGGAMALLHLALSQNPGARLRSWREKTWCLVNRDHVNNKGMTQTQPRIKYSYGPAIAFGFFAFISWGGLV